jgi:transcriptional regulator with XRE-family HTH domain
MNGETNRGRLTQSPDQMFWRRVAAGLSQHDAAVAVSIDPATLSRIERGRTSAKPPVLAALASLYECDITDLMAQNPAGKVA